MTELKFAIGVCRLFPGTKLAQGDPRWGEHTYSFFKASLTITSLVKVVCGHGYAISAVMNGGHRKKDNFISAQHIGLDFDQEDEAASIEGMIKDPFIQAHAALVHETASSTPAKPRGRALFILDQPFTNAEDYREACEAMVWRFKGADEYAKDAARLFFGRKGAKHVVLGNLLYRDTLENEVVQPYLLLDGPIKEKTRNTSLTRIAGWLHRVHSDDEVLALALMINDARCNPPLPEAEVQAVVRSACSYPNGSGQGGTKTLSGTRTADWRIP
jgi:hypothetical protein